MCDETFLNEENSFRDFFRVIWIYLSLLDSYRLKIHSFILIYIGTLDVIVQAFGANYAVAGSFAAKRFPTSSFTVDSFAARQFHCETVLPWIVLLQAVSPQTVSRRASFAIDSFAACSYEKEMIRKRQKIAPQG